MALEREEPVLETFPRLSDPDGIDPWPEEHERESAEMPDRARRRLFDEWFATASEPDDEVATWEVER